MHRIITKAKLGLSIRIWFSAILLLGGMGVWAAQGVAQNAETKKEEQSPKTSATSTAKASSKNRLDNKTLPMVPDPK